MATDYNPYLRHWWRRRVLAPTLMALFSKHLFCPISAAASILTLTSIGNGFLSRDLADIVIAPFVTLRCCHTELNGSVTLWLYCRVSDCQLLKTWTLWFYLSRNTHVCTKFKSALKPCLPWSIENTFRHKIATIRNCQIYSTSKARSV